MDQRYERIFRSVKKALRLHRSMVDRTLGPAMYQGQVPIIVYIEKNPRCRLIDIANGLNISRAAVTKSIDRLVNNGMIEKIEEPDDHRVCRVALTNGGKKKIACGKTAFENTIAQALDRKSVV